MARKSVSTAKSPTPGPSERRTVDRKAATAQIDALTAQLSLQRTLLDQIKLCTEIIQADPALQAVSEWRDRLEFLLSSNSHAEFNGLIRRQLADVRIRSAIDFDLPTDTDQQLLVGMTFAEASSTSEDDAEKRGIVACILNMGYYATYTVESKTCYNSSFGDGSILSAIKKGSAAYGSAQWKRVMDGDALLSKDTLEKILIPSEIKKLKACVQSVTNISGGTAPIKDPKSNRNLLQFNRADDSPPNPQRQEKVDRYGSHTFYAFKSGRECQ